MQVAAHEAKVGHGKLAMELRDMIDAARAHAAADEQRAKLCPWRGRVANWRAFLASPLPRIRLADMVQNKQATEQLALIMKEQHMFARIREHGLSPRRKLLLVGPPGTGKTMTASALAGELGIPLFLVRLDALITKFMGETAAKLRQVFDHCRSPGHLLLRRVRCHRLATRPWPTTSARSGACSIAFCK